MACMYANSITVCVSHNHIFLNFTHHQTKKDLDSSLSKVFANTKFTVPQSERGLYGV